MARFKKASDIKVGVIGYGGVFDMGRSHLNWAKQQGMTAAAVAEIDPARLKAAEADFPGIEAYESVSEMLARSGVKLVVIITPHNTHAKLALQCLRSGRHVVCEKPMAITTVECDRMIDAAQKHRLVLSAFHNRHWDGCVVAAVKAIRSGAIGRVCRISARTGGYGKPGDWWRSSRSISGGILYDWGVHFLEYGLQIVDDDIVEVSGFEHSGHWAGQTPWKKDTNEDEASIVVRFKGGAWLSLTVTQIDHDPRPGWFDVTGTKGSYWFDHSVWQIVKKVGGRTITTKGRSPSTRWDLYYRNLRDHLVKGAPLVITPQWSRRPIHILDLAGQSARKGAAMRAKHH